MADANELKDKGNEEFKVGNFLKAAAVYTQAIKLDPSNAVLYSNRSAALLKLKKVTKALEDADKCISLKPDWDKGYYRKGAIFEETEKFAEAVEAYKQSLAFNPNNAEVSKKIRSLGKVVKAAEKHAAEETIENFLASLSNKKLSGLISAILTNVKEMVQKSGPSDVATLHLLPGPKAAEHAEEEENVRATSAFSTPDNFSRFVEDMRSLSDKLDAVAMVSVIAKSVVAYPQKWVQQGWPCGKSDGLFVQVESREGSVKRCWFLPINPSKTLGKSVLLDSKFAPLEPLIR
mmetsp:Transcript_10677/g.19498  ORF Transcript_10677/g.19498 Transcript_10677/m.19498 type:complete len:290 (-) Transcript_10677:158-1027(-)